MCQKQNRIEVTREEEKLRGRNASLAERGEGKINRTQEGGYLHCKTE